MIPPEFQDLLDPLERFESIRRRAVRMGDRLCDLSYANPYGGVQDKARAVLRAALDDERLLDLQYSPFGGQTLVRRAVADDLRARYDLPFAFADVVLTPGAMAALQLALRACGCPDDEVITPIPCWLDYPLYARATDRVPIVVPLRDGSFTIDADALERASSQRTCAVLLSHPANPTGRNYGPEELAELARTLRRAETRFGCEITLIGDETHRDFTRPGEFRSASTFFDRTLVVYSFGKYHFMQGQRLGYVAVSPRHPRREAVGAELVRWTRITGTATPTSLMQRAVPGLLGLDHDHSSLVRWRERFYDALSAAGYVVVDSDATMFLYARTPGDTDDLQFVEELAREGVLVLPAPVFHHRGYFRISLTGSEEMLERALPVLERFGER
jgi:aspartate aminotransferase